jgi:hypothetical protein
VSAFDLARVVAHHADRFPGRPCPVWGELVVTCREELSRVCQACPSEIQRNIIARAMGHGGSGR